MTTIQLYNTRTRRKEDFAPLDPVNVRMYVCGPTVYDRAHLGNARPVVVFDVLYRLLRHVYGTGAVTYARNFTDVDDKINARAAESGRAISEITDETIQWFLDDMGALGALEPDVMPRATEFIPQMVRMIETLIAKGHAYAAEGHVLFAVDSYKAYGALSGRSVKDMIAGARVEVAPYKRNPMDFVLWKPSSGNQPGWDSPWGYGRPGWHIECSAMADKLLWEDVKDDLSDEAKQRPHTFDIHGGGNDLMFPHHENEIAQSCCAHPEADFARYWMHNEMLQVEGKKMSKSLGNFFTVRDLLDQGVPGEVVRFVFLRTHYRKPMDWTAERAKEATGHLSKYQTLQRQLLAAYPELSSPTGKVDQEIIQALANDLNTPLALTRLHKLAGEAMSIRTFGLEAASSFLASLHFLGFGDIDVQAQKSDKAIRGAIDAHKIVNELATSLDEARAERNYEKADSIRDNLINAGVRVDIGKSGTTWELLSDFDPSKLEALK